MQRRQGWLFPMMVVAAAAMIAFGCIGIAGITGRLPLAPPATGPLDGAQTKPSTLFAAESALQDSTAAAPTHDPGTALGAPPIVRN
jgi:hypothetical protein